MTTDGVGPGDPGDGLVGRVRELAALVGALRDPPSVVLVEGAAGLGKSALVRAALAVAGRSAVHLACRPAGPRPRWPDRPPDVLVVEDVQWLDRAGRDELRGLVAELTGPTCLVVTYRPDPAEPAGAPLGGECRCPPGVRLLDVRLEPLSRAEVAGFLAARGGARDEGAVEEVRRLSGGIPALLAAAAGPATGPGAVVELPPAAAQWLTGCRQELPPVGRLLLSAAAVLARPSTEPQLAAVAGVDEDDVVGPLCSLLGDGLLREVTPGRYEVAAGLLQRWLYQRIPAPRRRRLHGRAVDALAAGEPADLVALVGHCRSAGDAAASVRHAETAAEALVAAGDTAAAITLLQEALVVPAVPAAVRARLAVRLARIATVGLRGEDTEGVLRRLLGAGPLPAGVRGEIRLGLGLLLMNQAGRGDTGRQEIARAVGELRRRPALAARAMSALAMPQWGNCHAEEHLRWLAQAELATGQGRDRALTTAVFANRLSLLMNLGHPSVWRELELLPDHEGTVAQQQQVGRAYANLTDAAVWLGHYGAAAGFSREARRLAAQAGAEYVVALTRGAELRMDWAVGRWAGLDAHAERLLRDLESLPLLVADGRLALAQLAVARAEWTEALALLDVPQLVDVGEGCGPELSAASAVRVRAWLGLGQPANAAEEGRRALDRERVKGVWGWSGELVRAAVEALVGSGHVTEARTAVDDLAAGVAGRDTPLSAAALLSCRAVLAAADDDPTGAAVLHARAQQEYERLPRPYDASRELEGVARGRIAAGEPADDLLAAAAERYAAVGAAYDAARCRHLLRARGVAAPRRHGRRGYGGALSPREQEVARLMGRGRTNREIADSLFLSPRTVELHAARVLRKLGLTDREQVAGRLP